MGLYRKMTTPRPEAVTGQRATYVVSAPGMPPRHRTLRFRRLGRIVYLVVAALLFAGIVEAMVLTVSR